MYDVSVSQRCHVKTSWLASYHLETGMEHMELFIIAALDM